MDPELRQLTLADDPVGWSEAGFTVAADRARIGGVTLDFTGDPDRTGILGWWLTGVDAGSIDGLTTQRAQPEPGPTSDPVHPNGTTLIDHVVAASPDLPRTVDALDRVGIGVRRTRDTDQYGGPMRQVFFRIGRPVLELIGPPEPSDERPASFWGLALTVTDLDATKDLLGDGLGDPKPAVQPGRRIATLRHRAFAITVPIAFMSA
jgi:hypothetical protein